MPLCPTQHSSQEVESWTAWQGNEATKVHPHQFLQLFSTPTSPTFHIMTTLLKPHHAAHNMSKRKHPPISPLSPIASTIKGAKKRKITPARFEPPESIPRSHPKTSSPPPPPRRQTHKRPSTKRVTLKPRPPRRATPLTSLPAALQLPTQSTTTFPTVIPDTSTKPPILAKPEPVPELEFPSQTQTAAAHRLRILHAVATTLQALHVRHRNQHGGQGWWRAFRGLRKGVVKLTALEVGLWNLRYGDGAAAPAGLDGSEGGGDGGGSGGGGGGEVRTEAEKARRQLAEEEELEREKGVWERWVREVVVPRAYVAGGAVVRDGQFAGLGVVLVGLVAEVGGVVGGVREVEGMMGEGVDGGRGEAVKVGSVSQRKVRREDVGEVMARNHEGQGVDVGEVVPRRSLRSKAPVAHSEDAVEPDEQEEDGLVLEDVDMADFPEEDADFGNDFVANLDEVEDTLHSPATQSSPFAAFGDLPATDTDTDTDTELAPKAYPPSIDAPDRDTEHTTTDLATRGKLATDSPPPPPPPPETGAKTASLGTAAKTTRRGKKRIDEEHEATAATETIRKSRNKADASPKEELMKKGHQKKEKRNEQEEGRRGKGKKKGSRKANAIDDLFADFA